MSSELLTGQELTEHILELAADNEVAVWVCLNCDDEGGEAVLQSGGRYIFLSLPIDTPKGYLTALHEIGHHRQWGQFGLRLDAEAAAWEYALTVTRVEPGPDEWAYIAEQLGSYVEDGRFKVTERYEAMLEEARLLAR